MTDETNDQLYVIFDDDRAWIEAYGSKILKTALDSNCNPYNIRRVYAEERLKKEMNGGIITRIVAKCTTTLWFILDDQYVANYPISPSREALKIMISVRQKGYYPECQSSSHPGRELIIFDYVMSTKAGCGFYI